MRLGETRQRLLDGVPRNDRSAARRPPTDSDRQTEHHLGWSKEAEPSPTARTHVRIKQTDKTSNGYPQKRNELAINGRVQLQPAKTIRGSASNPSYLACAISSDGKQRWIKAQSRLGLSGLGPDM
jgi:hypothetical protein